MLVVFVLMFSVMYLPKVTNAALSEVEPNDSNTTATPIDAGKWYDGYMKGGYRDYDYFKITTPSDGNLVIHFNNDGVEDERPDLYIRDSKGNVYESVEGRGDLVGDEKINVSLPKGDYYFEVYDSFFSDSYQYRIKAEFTEGNYFEKEFNDSLIHATKMNLNKEYSGRISGYDDKDYYKVTLNNPGKLNVCFNNDQADDESPEIRVLDGKKNEFTKFKGRSDLVGAECEKVGVGTGDYYIEIDDRTSDHYSYTLSTEFQATEYYEREFNNNLTTSTPIQLNKTYHGEVNDSYEKDYFSFTLPFSGKVKLKVNFNSGDNTDLAVNLLDGKGNEYLDFTSDGNSLVSSESLSSWRLLCEVRSR